MRHYWLATEAKTGKILADLPLLDVPRVSQTIGRYETASARFPLVGKGVPPDWERILTPGATVFWLLRENPSDPAHGVPVWGGMITEDPLTAADSVTFPMATLESYLDRRYIGDETFSNYGQNLLVKHLVETYIADGPNGGLPIRVEIVNGGNGKLRTREEYKSADDKTVYSVLKNLMEVIDGPEWTMGGEWQTSPERITPVFYVGDRIGTAKPASLPSAHAVFDMPGCVTDFKRYRSYADGKGANAVMATSSGQGDERPESELVVTPDTLRPTFEYRFTPSTSIKEVSTLDRHAQARAAALAGGTVVLELTASVGLAPALGVDWRIGDDIGYSIGVVSRKRIAQPPVLVDGEGYAEEDEEVIEDTWELDGEGYYTPPKDRRPIVPAFPRGIEGTARAVGWEMEPQGNAKITPILAGGELG